MLSVSTSSTVADDASPLQTLGSSASTDEQFEPECTAVQQRLPLRLPTSSPVQEASKVTQILRSSMDRIASFREHVDVTYFVRKADTLHAKITSMGRQLTAGIVDSGVVKGHLTEFRIEVQKLDVECVDAARFCCGLSKRRLEELHQQLRKSLAYIEEVLAQCQSTTPTVPRFSIPSAKAIQILADAGRKLEEFEQRFYVIRKTWASRSASAAVLKKELTELETEVKHLETNSVDSVSLVELSSGRQIAKSLRKRELVRLEQLFGHIDNLFKAVSVHD